MRPHETKTDCIILDCAGLTYEHGFVDDPREWTLHGKFKKHKDKEVWAHICPECGFEMPDKTRKIKNTETDMVEFTPSMVADLRAKRVKYLEMGKCKTLDDFKELGRLRRYKDGSAYHKWNERKEWLQENGYPVPSE